MKNEAQRMLGAIIKSGKPFREALRIIEDEAIIYDAGSAILYDGSVIMYSASMITGTSK